MTNIEQLWPIFNAMPGSFLILSTELKLLAINDELQKATSLNREASIGRYIFDVLPDDPLNSSGSQLWKASLEKVLANREPDEMPIVKYSVNTSKDQTGFIDKYWRAGNHPVLDSDGNVQFIIHRTEEITELYETRKGNSEAQQKSKDAEARIKFALDAAEIGDWEMSLTNGSTARSLKHDQCFGYQEAQSEWSLAHALRHIHPEERDMVAKAHLDAMNDLGPMSFECRVIWPDESLHWITVRARTEKNSEGKPIRLAGLVWDITKEKKRSEELKEGEKRFRDLANALPQLAWMADSTGYIFWYNQRWYDYTGTTLEQMLGWGWKAVHDPEHTARVIEKWVESLKTGEAWEDTFPLRGLDGTFRWFLSQAQPILDGDGQVYRWFGTNTDITVQRESQIALQAAVKKANEASELKSAFLANMSHEIRTPLGAILGFTDLLQDHQLAPDEKKSFHEIVKRNGEQLSSLINDILDLSKVEAGQFKAEVGPTNIRDLLEEVCSTMVVKAQERRLNYRWHMNGDVPNVVATDPLRVRQVLMNVIGNAIKFTHDGNVDVTASLGSDKSIRFTVTDTGIGLSFEQADKLFQPFSQADPSITRKYGGTGLGLVLSRQLARALGGDLILKSSVTGKGTAFEFWIKDQIPANEQPEMPAETKAKRAPNSTDPSNSIENLKGVRVLLVDDSPDNRHLISRILKKQGAVVSEAVNGAEGVDAAFEGDFDIILMDLQMPVLDGYSAIQKLRESNWKNPIIALTAHAMSEVRTNTLKVGANDYMTKPLKADELVFKIKLYTAASTRK